MSTQTALSTDILPSVPVQSLTDSAVPSRLRTDGKPLTRPVLSDVRWMGRFTTLWLSTSQLSLYLCIPPAGCPLQSCVAVVQRNEFSGHNVTVLLPMCGSHTFVLWSSRPSYHCTIISDLHASLWPLGVCNELNWPLAQSISRFWVLNHGIPSPRSHALIGTTSTSSLYTRAKWFIYWTVITILQLSRANAITWQSWLWIVMCTASRGSPSQLTSCGAMKMLVAPQTMSAHIVFNVLCQSRIRTSSKMCGESGLSVPHKYSLHLRAFGLSKTTISLNTIWCGWISSNVAVNVLIPND